MNCGIVSAAEQQQKKRRTAEYAEYAQEFMRKVTELRKDLRKSPLISAYSACSEVEKL